MLDTCPLPPLTLHRAELHLKGRVGAPTLTAEAPLLRSCMAAEMRRAPFIIRAACLLPRALYLVFETPDDPDPLPRLLRLTASFKRHAEADVSWHWPALAPLPEDQSRSAISEVLEMPVAWGLAARAEDWPFSSLARGGVNPALRGRVPVK